MYYHSDRVFIQVNRIHSYNYLKREQRINVKRAHHVDLHCRRTVFSSLLPQSPSSQNVQAHRQANQVNGQTQETAVERSACDTGNTQQHQNSEPVPSTSSPTAENLLTNQPTDSFCDLTHGE